MAKRVWIILLPLILLASGCTFHQGGVRLINFSDLFNSHPDYVTVRKGDTLYSISRRYNVPIRDLVEANGLTPPYTLTIGRVLRMPGARYHTVAKGDTLYSISKKYDVDLRSLSRINRLNEPYTLAIGQRLVLPGSLSNTETASYKAATPKTTPSRWSWKSSSSAKTTAKKTARSSRSKAQPVSKYRKTKFLWPVKGTVISHFGTIGKGHTNDGINIKAALGTNVKAADKGTVAYAGNELKGFGNLILIKHDDGWITAYAHNDRLFVKKGQRVARGEKIATVGSTGGVNTPQLHFEVRSGKKALNPTAYLP